MSPFVELLSKYIDNLQIEGDFATGQIDTDEKYSEFKNALRTFGYSFTIRSSRKENNNVPKKGKNEGNSGATITIKSEEEDDDKRDARRLPGRGSLMFKSSSDVSVPFFGSPFIVETTIYFTCSQGIKYYGSKKYPDEMFREGDPLSKKRRKAKVTQKIGCQARMTVKKIKVFTGDDYIVSRDNWREKKASIDLLKQDFINTDKVVSLIRYCIVLSLDISHNHEAKVREVKRPKQNQYDPARKVIKLHDQMQEAVSLLSSDLVTKCTNIVTLSSAYNSLKTIITQLRDSVELQDGIPLELITAALDKMTQKQLRAAALQERKAAVAAKKRHVKAERASKVEPVEADANTTNPISETDHNDSENQVIEIPSFVEGAQVFWDPLNVSWVHDGQSIVLQETNTPTTQRAVKDGQSIVIQRRSEDVPLQNQNIGVITQGGQNYTIVQHGHNVHIPNLGVSVPIMAKVVHPTTILSSANTKKIGKRNDVGVTAIAIPANVEWNQQNWGQITQVVGDTQFTTNTLPTQTIWNISQ